MDEAEDLLEAAGGSNQLPPGAFFEGFEIISQIGSGASADVYKARRISLDKLVALKLLKRELLNEKGSLRRFKNEALILSKLQHNNIVSILSYGIASDGKQPYLAMELVEGKSLEEILSSGEWKQLNLQTISSIILQIVDGLSYAQSFELVHRDLKPANIMLVSGDDDQELVKILDFGIAKILDQNQTVTEHTTQTGLMLGSPAYMSPEQCSGLGADRRSDIYSLSCILYELLLGHSLYEGEAPLDIMYRKVHEKPVLFKDKREVLALGQNMKALLERGLQKLPEDRIQSLEEFRREFIQANAAMEQKCGAARARLLAKNVGNGILLPAFHNWFLTAVSLVLALIVAFQFTTEIRKMQKVSLDTPAPDKPKSIRPQIPTIDFKLGNARALERDSRNKEAIESYRQALDILYKEPQKDIARICEVKGLIAQVYFNQGLLKEGRNELKSAIALAGKESNTELVESKSTELLGYYEYRLGNFQEAESWLNRALKLNLLGLGGEDYSETASIYEKLAEVEIDWGHKKDAEKYARKAYEIELRCSSSAHEETIKKGCVLALALQVNNKEQEQIAFLDDMESHLDAAKERREMLTNVANAYCYLGEYCLYKKSPSEPKRAKGLFEKALNIVGNSRLALNYWAQRCSNKCLADIAAKNKQKELALKYAEKAIEATQPYINDLPVTYYDIGNVLSSNFPQEAVVYYQKTLSLLEGKPVENGKMIAYTHLFLTQAYFKLNQIPRADKLAKITQEEFIKNDMTQTTYYTSLLLTRQAILNRMSIKKVTKL